MPTKQPLPVGGRGRMSLMLCDGRVMFDGEGEVVSSTSHGGTHDRPGMVVRWEALDDHAKDVLRQLETSRTLSRSVPLPSHLRPRPRPGTVPEWAEAPKHDASDPKLPADLLLAECTVVDSKAPRPVAAPVVASVPAALAKPAPLPRISAPTRPPASSSTPPTIAEPPMAVAPPVVAEPAPVAAAPALVVEPAPPAAAPAPLIVEPAPPPSAAEPAPAPPAAAPAPLIVEPAPPPSAAEPAPAPPAAPVFPEPDADRPPPPAGTRADTRPPRGKSESRTARGKSESKPPRNKQDSQPPAADGRLPSQPPTPNRAGRVDTGAWWSLGDAPPSEGQYGDDVYDDDASTRRRRLLIIGGASVAAVLVLFVIISLFAGGTTKSVHQKRAEKAEQVAKERAAAVATAAAANPADAADAAAPARPCRVTFGSRPDGAEVLIDGKPVGKTPFAKELPCGPVAATLKLDRYRPATVEATSSPEGGDVTVTLERPQITVLVVSSPSGAAVSLAGKPVGTTPAKVKLPAFETSAIQVSKAGFVAATKKVSPHKNGERVAIALKRRKR